MKGEKLVEALGMVDEEYIDEAAPALQKRTTTRWVTWAARAAAAVVCAAGIGVYSFQHFGGRNTEILTPDETPAPSMVSTEQEMQEYHEDGKQMLTPGLYVDGMGFEGLLFYDISESGSLNPWTKDVPLETLPVYRNLSYVNGSGYAICLTDEELLAKATQTAESLGTEIISTKFEHIPGYDDFTVADRKKSYQLTAITGLGKIHVNGNGHINIFLEPEIVLPQEYQFTWHETSDEEAKEVLSYLLEQYQALHGFTESTSDSWGDYSYSGERKREYYAFDSNGNTEQQILNYNFNKIEFTPSEDGKLWIIRYGNVLESAEKIDDYPIISWETAQKLLLQGDYITTVPEEYLVDGIVKEEYIAKVELIYRTGSFDKVYMPYYRFYVELSEMENVHIDKNLKDFGVFYVPAVSGEYLTNFPVWEGTFN